MQYANRFWAEILFGFDYHPFMRYGRRVYFQYINSGTEGFSVDN